MSTSTVKGRELVGYDWRPGGRLAKWLRRIPATQTHLILKGYDFRLDLHLVQEVKRLRHPSYRPPRSRWQRFKDWLG